MQRTCRTAIIGQHLAEVKSLAKQLESYGTIATLVPYQEFISGTLEQLPFNIILILCQENYLEMLELLKDARGLQNKLTVIVASHLSESEMRLLFINGADDVVCQSDITHELFQEWNNKCDNNSIIRSSKNCDLEAAVQRGMYLEQSLSEGKVPTYYMNTNRVEYLRVDVTSVSNSANNWRYFAILTWVDEFGANSSFVCIRPNSFSGLRLGAMVDIDEENRALFREKLLMRLDRYFSAVEKIGCVCAASSCNAEYLDLFSANTLDDQNEQVFFLRKSQFIQQRRSRENPGIDATLLKEFGEALMNADISLAVAKINQVVDTLCRNRPTITYAYEMMSRFSRVCSVVMKVEYFDFLLLPTTCKNLYAMRDYLVNQIKKERVELTGINTKTMKKQEQINALILEVKANPTRSYTTNTAARQLGYSRSHFCRIFQSCTGSSFAVFVRKNKLRYASELLSKTGLRMEEVASMIGYPNTWYFRKIFEKQFGVSPEKYSQQSDLHHNVISP